jgi:hypothetical protein
MGKLRGKKEKLKNAGQRNRTGGGQNIFCKAVGSLFFNS